jgi:hypothetical protein
MDAEDACAEQEDAQTTSGDGNVPKKARAKRSAVRSFEPAVNATLNARSMRIMVLATTAQTLPCGSGCSTHVPALAVNDFTQQRMKQKQQALWEVEANSEAEDAEANGTRATYGEKERRDLQRVRKTQHKRTVGEERPIYGDNDARPWRHRD